MTENEHYIAWLKRRAYEIRVEEFEKGKIQPGSHDEENLKLSLEQAGQGEFISTRGPKSTEPDRRN